MNIRKLKSRPQNPLQAAKYTKGEYTVFIDANLSHLRTGNSDFEEHTLFSDIESCGDRLYKMGDASHIGRLHSHNQQTKSHRYPDTARQSEERIDDYQQQKTHTS